MPFSVYYPPADVIQIVWDEKNLSLTIFDDADGTYGYVIEEFNDKYGWSAVDSDSGFSGPEDIDAMMASVDSMYHPLFRELRKYWKE